MTDVTSVLYYMYEKDVLFHITNGVLMYIIETFKNQPPTYNAREQQLSSHRAACDRASIERVPRFEQWINVWAKNGYRVAACNNLSDHFHKGGLVLKDITVFFIKD